MAKDFEPRLPTHPFAVPVVPGYENRSEWKIGQPPPELKDNTPLRSPELTDEEIEAYVLRPRRQRIAQVNAVRKQQGVPEIVDAPMFSANLSGDIDFEDWIESQAPGKTTGQYLAKGGTELMKGLLAVPEAGFRALDLVAEAAGSTLPGAYGHSIAPLKDWWDEASEPPEGVSKERTWTGAGIEMAGQLVPFMAPGAGIPNLLASGANTGADIVEQTVPNASAGEKALGMGIGLGAGTASLGVGKLAAKELGRVMPAAKPAVTPVPTGILDDTVQFSMVASKESVLKATATDVAKHAVSGAGMMGSNTALLGAGLAAQGEYASTPDLQQAGLEHLAQSPAVAGEGLLFGAMGVPYGIAGARARNKAALTEGKGVLAQGFDYKTQGFQEPAIQARQEAQLAEQTIRDQEAANINAAKKKEQRLREEAVLTRQAADAEAAAIRQADIERQQRAIEETSQNLPFLRLPSTPVEPVRARVEALESESVVPWRKAAEAKEAKAAQVLPKEVDRATVEAADVAKQKAAEATAKADADSVALAKELKAYDLDTFEGQRKAIEVLNRKPVAERPVEPVLADGVDKLRSVPGSEARPGVEGRGTPEVGFPEDTTVVGIRIGQKDYPGERKGAEYNQDGEYIGERVRLQGENHDRIVQETDIKVEPDTLLTTDHPGFDFADGTRVFDKSGKKTGEVVATMPGDTGVVSVHWDNARAPVRELASDLRRGAEPLPILSKGRIVQHKEYPDRRYRVLSEEAGGILRVQKENGGETTLSAHDVVEVARNKPVNEEAVSKALQDAGANLEVKKGNLRKAGSTTPGLPLQWVHDVFVTTPERRSLFEDVRKDPKARAVWEKEHGKRFPDTFEKFDKLDKTAPAEGVYDAKNAVSQIAVITPETIVHEAAHHVLTTRLNESEVTGLMREHKKETGNHPETKTDKVFQEWFADKIADSLKTANTAPLKVQGPISKAVQWIKNILVKMGVMKPGEKVTPDHLSVFNTVARQFRTGELLERPAQRVEVEGDSFFAKKTGKKEDPAFTRSEEYDPKPFEKSFKYFDRDQAYFTSHARTQLMENIVNSARKAAGESRRQTLPEMEAQAKKEGLHDMTTDQYIDYLLNASENAPVAAETAMRMNRLAEHGDLAKTAEFLFATNRSKSDAGRTLGVFSHRTQDAVSRKNAMLMQTLELNPYEMRRYNAAADRIAKNRENADPKDREIVRKLGIIAAGRSRRVTDALRDILGIDFNDPTALRRFEDPVSFFRLKYTVNELMMKEQSFLDGFREAEGATAKTVEAAVLAHRVLFEYWCNAVLSGGHTHTLGIVGNPLSFTYHSAIVRPIEALNGTIFGGTTAKVGDLPAYYSGFFKGLIPALRNGYESFRAGNDVFEAQTLGGRHNTAYEHSGDAIPTLAGGKIIRSVRGLLIGVDSLAKTMTAHMEVGIHARRLAREANLTGEKASDFIESQMKSITSEAWAVATNRAKQQYGGSTSGESLTSAGFGHADSTDGLRNAIKQFQSFKIAHPLPGAALSWAVPFLSNPAAWARQAARLTPLQAVNIAIKHAREKSDPKFKWSNADKSKDIAELFAGTALMTLAYSMTGWTASDGLPVITGMRLGRQAPGENDLLRRLGYSDKSLMTPFGRVNLRSMSPVVEIMQLASAVRTGQEKPAKDAWERTGNIAGSVGANTADIAMNLLSTVNTLVDARKDDTGETYVRYGTRLVGGFNPKIVKDIRELNTPGVADARVDTSLASSLDPASAPRKIDYFGRPFEAYDENRAGMFWGVMKLAGIAPTDPGEKGDIRLVDEWLNRMKKHPAPPAHKSDKDIPETSPNYFSLDGKQYEAFLRETGQIHKGLVEKATRAFDFDPLKEPNRADVLEGRLTKWRSHINAVVLEKTLRPNTKLDRVLSQIQIDGYKDLLGLPSPHADNAVRVFSKEKQKTQPKKQDPDRLLRYGENP